MATLNMVKSDLIASDIVQLYQGRVSTQVQSAWLSGLDTGTMPMATLNMVKSDLIASDIVQLYQGRVLLFVNSMIIIIPSFMSMNEIHRPYLHINDSALVCSLSKIDSHSRPNSTNNIRWPNLYSDQFSIDTKLIRPIIIIIKI